MPSQYVSIKSKDWRQPIDNYIFEQDQEIKIPASDVIHVRLPNLEYNQGANFMGMSPVKVAASVVDTLNYGREYVKQSFKRGMPPGILARKGDASPTQAHEYKAQLERQWLSKHGKYTRAGIPIFGLGEYTWIKIGFDNFRDMQIIENNAEAFRTLCNIWGVPAIVFNDTAGTTFNNQAEARKSIYTNRVIPDLKLLSSYINASLAPAYTENIIKFDFSGIEELQKDKRQQAEWVGVLVDKGIITRNQALEIMGLEKSEDPGMDDRLVPFNLAPLSSVIGELPPQQEVDKMLYAAGIDDYKMKK
jgi:HK97 family phage portal protein